MIDAYDPELDPLNPANDALRVAYETANELRATVQGLQAALGEIVVEAERCYRVTGGDPNSPTISRSYGYMRMHGIAKDALAGSPPAGVFVSDDLLKWLGEHYEMYGELPTGPRASITNLSEPQWKEWKCDGCDAVDREYWPRWELSERQRPFKHTTTCKWVSLRALLSAHTGEKKDA